MQYLEVRLSFWQNRILLEGRYSRVRYATRLLARMQVGLGQKGAQLEVTSKTRNKTSKTPSISET